MEHVYEQIYTTTLDFAEILKRLKQYIVSHQSYCTLKTWAHDTYNINVLPLCDFTALKFTPPHCRNTGILMLYNNDSLFSTQTHP